MIDITINYEDELFPVKGWKDISKRLMDAVVPKDGQSHKIRLTVTHKQQLSVILHLMTGRSKKS
jgi:hypothetical protein